MTANNSTGSLNNIIYSQKTTIALKTRKSRGPLRGRANTTKVNRPGAKQVEKQMCFLCISKWDQCPGLHYLVKKS